MARVVVTRADCTEIGQHVPAGTTASPRWPSGRTDLICTTYGALLGVGICLPLFGGRPVFLLDWVIGPHTPLVPTSVYGLNGGLTAGILGALGTAAFLHVVGEAATWLVLFAFFPVASVAAGRLVGGSVFARLAAATVMCVNPWVFNRIYAGDLMLLLGFALLPFAVASALRDRVGHDVTGALVCALWWATLTALAPQFAWIYVAVVAVGAVALWARRRTPRRRWRSIGAAVTWFAGSAGAFVAMTLYVLIPQASNSLPVTVSTATLRIYATTGDPHLGLFANVAGLYGFWNRSPGLTLPKDVVTGWPFLLLAILIVVASGYWVTLRRQSTAVRDRVRRARAWAVLACGVLGYALALGTQGPTGPLFRWAYRTVPFFDVLREPQASLMLTVLMYSLGVGWAIEHLIRAHTRPQRSWAQWAMAATAGIALPLAYTPTIFDGLAGQIAPSTIPPAYARADRLMGSGSGQVLFLPWHLYESLPFAGDRVIANLGPSLFTRPVISGDNVQVGDLGTQSTSLRSRYVEGLLDGAYSRADFGAQVAPLGVEYVVVAKVVDWASYGWLFHEHDLRLVLDSPPLEVWRNLAFHGVGQRSGTSRPVVEASPVAYRIPPGTAGVATLDAPFEPGWTLGDVAGRPTRQGTVRFQTVNTKGGMAVFSPWSAAQAAYLASVSVAVVIIAILVVGRVRRARVRLGTFQRSPHVPSP